MGRRVVTVSEVQTYDLCPQMWAWRWVAKKQGESSTALRLGTAVHQWFASRLRYGKSVGKLTEVAAGLHEEDVEQAEALDLVLPEWERRYGVRPPWDEVLAVEKEMTLDQGGITFMGKPDAVVRWMGKIWHVQHKTVSRGTPFVKYSQRIQKSLHEGLYCTMLERMGEVAGTMLNAVRKLSRNTLSRDPGQGLHLEFLPITPELREAAIHDLWLRGGILPDYERTLDSKNPRAYRNRQACHGPFGNSQCAYYGLCWEGKSVEEFADAEPLEHYKTDGGEV